MTAITLPFIEDNAPFPNVETALSEPDGLLAFGGDLSVKRLTSAYQSGIFPWFSDGEPLLWWSPSVRAIIRPDTFHISRSLKKAIRKQAFSITINSAFDDVITACASVPRYTHNGELSGTWITSEMIQAYQRLHHHGFAHSIEVWQNDKLVGGLYGVVTHGVFCGESMFYVVSNASKVAMATLAVLLLPYGDGFIDCQMPTEHLSSLGAESIPRSTYLKMLDVANQNPIPKHVWQPRDLTECLV
jgi:leucyl/phenylalanyl-tRNA--protein transferase